MEASSFLAYICLTAVIIGLLGGILVDYRWYWLAILASYNFSFLTGFTIGQTVMVVVWILLALVIGHSLGWITNFKRTLMASLLGTAIWLLTVLTIDDYWLFFPLRLLYKSAGLLH